jgi:hypothetical protein
MASPVFLHPPQLRPSVCARVFSKCNMTSEKIASAIGWKRLHVAGYDYDTVIRISAQWKGLPMTSSTHYCQKDPQIHTVVNFSLPESTSNFLSNHSEDFILRMCSIALAVLRNSWHRKSDRQRTCEVQTTKRFGRNRESLKSRTLRLGILQAQKAGVRLEVWIRGSRFILPMQSLS